MILNSMHLVMAWLQSLSFIFNSSSCSSSNCSSTSSSSSISCTSSNNSSFISSKSSSISITKLFLLQMFIDSSSLEVAVLPTVSFHRRIHISWASWGASSLGWLPSTVWSLSHLLNRVCQSALRAVQSS